MTTLSEDQLEELVVFRRSLHQSPELAFDVAGTSARIAQRLQLAGLDVCENVGKNGLVASLNKGSNIRPVGFRADMDALPIDEANTFPHRSHNEGKFHGCGHDGHCSMLLGAALSLASDPGFDREVHFIFQPNEENGLGALEMINAGLFDRFAMDCVYGLHNLPGLEVGSFAINAGPFCSFEDNFCIQITGRGGHSSMPEKSIDAIPIGAKIILDLQNIVSRMVCPADHAVVSVTEFRCDGARNVLASNVEIRGDCRGFTAALSKQIKDCMEQITKGVCASFGASYQFEYGTSFIPLINTAENVDICAGAVEQIPNASCDANYGPVAFSEDFAQMLRIKPGAYILMGNGTQGKHHSQPLHNPFYDFNDNALRYGVEYWCALAKL